MVLVDKKILFGGIALFVVGTSLLIYLNAFTPVGRGGMSEQEQLDFLIAEQENQDLKTLSSILMGLGFLLILISFGARRKRKSAPTQEKKKPAE